jgi:DNA polymerase-4
MNVIFHVDLDAFYASVEQIDNPSLQGKAVIVGALPGHRGVVSSCSYEARRFGVRSAMPVSQAARRCPQGVFVPVRMKRYLEVSQAVMRILERFSPDFRQISIDEAFMDMSGTQRLYGAPLATGKTVKEKVRRQTGLTLSIGIAANRYLAKLASEHSKPDGLHFVQPGEEISFLDGLSLGNLWGVGEKTRERLLELNITSVQGLREYPKDILC